MRLYPQPGEARDEAWILEQLCAKADRPLFGSRLARMAFAVSQALKKLPIIGKSHALDHMFFNMITRKAGLGGLKNLRQHLDGLKLDDNQPGDYLGKRVATPSGKVELAPPELVARVDALEATYQDELNNSGALKLIQKRERFTHNSWTHNVPAFVKGDRHTNYLYIHPDDAGVRQLHEGEFAQVSANGRSIRVPVKFDKHIMPGTVSVPHGWGHQKAGGLSVAKGTGGANVNVLIPDGSASIEPISGMTHMNGVLVEVSPCPQRAK